MALPRPTSPHAPGSNRTPAIMRLELGACVPGLLTLTRLYGPGTLLNLAWGAPPRAGRRRPHPGPPTPPPGGVVIWR
ncbi:hypothetical protein ACPTGO_31590, partial [Pseudomonas aeruginosa]